MTIETHVHEAELPSEELTHTLASYMYRDAANYKMHGEVVVEGVLSEEEKSQILETLHIEDQFLPDQVGMPVLYTEFPSHYEDDHPWHELSDLETITRAQAAGRTTLDMTAAELHRAFVNATWDPTVAAADVENWKAATPAGR